MPALVGVTLNCASKYAMSVHTSLAESEERSVVPRGSLCLLYSTEKSRDGKQNYILYDNPDCKLFIEFHFTAVPTIFNKVFFLINAVMNVNLYYTKHNRG